MTDYHPGGAGADEMRFTDRLIRCPECGTEFIFTVTEQRDLVRQGKDPEPPETCPGCRALATPDGKQRGRVKWYAERKGYGFITQTNGADIFVHRSGLAEGVGILRENQLVEFDEIDDGGRPKAINVDVIYEEEA
jgi:CspA family cold shock protein